MNRLLARSAPLAICAALSGCTDLAAVRSISSQLQGATASWNDVSGEFLNSCQREQRLNPALSDCAVEKQASDGLVAMNNLLADYFKTLGLAAADSSFSIQQGITDASTSAAKIPGISATQVAAVSGLFGTLSALVGRALREKVLRDLIDNGAPHARTVVGALDTLVVENLRTRLASERTQLGSIFFAKILLAQSQSQESAAERSAVAGSMDDLCKGTTATALSGTRYLLALEYCRRTDILDKRVAALEDYRNSLATADKALVALQSNKTKLKGKALFGELFAVGQDLAEKITAVRDAFGPAAA
jgi:hypothetical protein